MVEARRPYSALSIETLETLFATQGTDVSFLSQLIAELSSRKTKRARLLLAMAAKNLTEYDSAEDQLSEPDLPDNETSEDEDWEAPDPESTDTAANGNPNNSGRTKQNFSNADKPPDDRKRPERLSSVRPVGTPGLPAPWVRPLNADRSLNIAAGADLPDVYIAPLSALIDEIKKTGAGQKR
jgi:hypothetical protein